MEPEQFDEATEQWLDEQVDALRLTDAQVRRAAEILGRTAQ